MLLILQLSFTLSDLKKPESSSYENYPTPMQVRLSKVFKASGVVVEQKSVRPTCSPFTPVGRVKGGAARNIKQG